MRTVLDSSFISLALLTDRFFHRVHRLSSISDNAMINLMPIDERILSAAKEDNEDLYVEAIEGEHDINHQDGYVCAL